jgi:signal transduction histidine kinase
LDDTQAAELNGGRRFPDHGTTLIISKLRSRWNTDSLKDLKFSLEKFLNPNQLFSCNQFKIFLSVPDIQLSEDDKDYPNRINGEVQNQIFQKLKFNATFIEAKVSDDNKIVSTTLFHEGEKVFELSEHNTSYQMLAGSHVIIYYLNTYKKAYFKRQTGARSVDFGSIFLFLNGFRIAPYGDRGDDWLQLDVRKTQGTQRYLSSRDLVGRIEINGNEQDFTPISSREGLKNTASFKQLKEVLFMDVLRKLEKFVVEGLQWDSVPDYLRHELQDNKGLDWDSTKEQYAESWERKQQRIALSIVSLMGSSREKLIKFWFNPSLLDGIIESRQEEVKDLLTNIDGFEPELIDNKLKKSISQLKKIIEQKEEAAKSAISYATELERETDTYRAQTLFMQQVTSLDVKQLLTFHHQIKLDSTIVNNYITKAINSLKDIPNTKTTIDNLQKALFANKRISAITQYATKANFRAGTKKENTDIPVFFEQYLLNVATDFIATGLKLVVINNVKEPFEVSISRVELSILIDNIISNSAKAQADKLTVTISKSSTNTLLISFLDDGNGLSEQLPNIESMFEMGITTTYGSGLGLYHAKEIIQKNGGKISAKPAQPNGMEIMVEITR